MFRHTFPVDFTSPCPATATKLLFTRFSFWAAVSLYVWHLPFPVLFFVVLNSELETYRATSPFKKFQNSAAYIFSLSLY